MISRLIGFERTLGAFSQTVQESDEKYAIYFYKSQDLRGILLELQSIKSIINCEKGLSVFRSQKIVFLGIFLIVNYFVYSFFMNYDKAELVQKILHQYLEKLKDGKEEGKVILKNLASANAGVVIGCLLDYLNPLEIDSRYLELMSLLNYIISHISEVNFTNLKGKIHQFISVSIQSSANLVRQPTQDQKIADIYNERDRYIENMVSSILKYKDKETIQLVLNLFQHGRVPDFGSLQLLRILIEEKGIPVSEYSNELLTKFLSTCTLIESATGRELYAKLLTLIYQGLQNCIENQTPEQSIELKSISDLTISIYSIITQDWVNESDQECSTVTVGLIGYMIQFFPPLQIQKLADKIINMFVNQLKKNQAARIPLCLSFIKVLEVLLQSNKSYFEHSIKSIQVQLYDLYKSPIFSPNIAFTPEIQRNKSALYGVLQNLAEFNADSILDLYVSRHSSKDTQEKIASLWITNFLVNRNYERLSIPMKKTLLNQIQMLVYDTNFEVRFVIVELLLSMWKQPSFYDDVKLLNLDSSFMLYFLIQQVSIHPQEIEDKKYVRFAPFETNLETIKSRAGYVLSILTNHSVEVGENNLIWPHILEFIPNPSFSPGLGTILKSIQTYIGKYVSTFKELPQIKSDNEKLPKIGTILSRLIILLRIPQFFSGLGVDIIKAIPHILSVYLQKEENSDITNTIKDLEYTLKTELEDEKKWCDKVYRLWKSLLDQFESSVWFINLNEDLISMQSSYKRIPELRIHMMKLHGIVLTKLENNEVIKQQIDRFITDVHNDYSNHTVNLNIEREEPTMLMRMCLADTLAFIASEKLELVIDKLRNVLNSQVIQKKQQSGFAAGFLGILKKTQSNEEILVPLTSNVIITLGHICNRLNSKKLASKIESHIINNLTPFLDRQNDEIQASTYHCIEMICRSALRIWGDCEQDEIVELKKALVKHKDKFYQRSVLMFRMTKDVQMKRVAWITATHLLKLDPVYSFQQQLSFFKICAVALNENLENIAEFEHEVILLFESMLHHQVLKSDPSFPVMAGISDEKGTKKESNEKNTSASTEKSDDSAIKTFGDDQGEVTVWETLKVLVKIIEQHSDLEILGFYYNCLLKSLYNRKLSYPLQKDTQNLTVILVVFLSHIYKENQRLQKVCLFTLEKIFIGMGVYLNVNMKDFDSFNEELILQLSSKLSFEDLQNLVNESISRVSLDEKVEVLQGFVSLHNKFYSLHEKELSMKLDYVLKSYTAVFEAQEKLECDETTKDQLIGYVMVIIQKNLLQGLNLLLEVKYTFPLSDFLSRILKKLVENKTILFKAFNHLTDVLNNPEDKLFRCKGDAMTNAIYFIGFMFSLNSEILLSVTQKIFPSIIGTFLLRFSTSFDTELNKASFYKGNSDGMNCSKICLWSFIQMLQNSIKSQIVQDFSTGLQSKLINEDEFENGILELLMIIAKKSKLIEIQDIMKFLKPFMLKKMKGQRRVSLMVVSQMIHSSHFASDFRDQDSTTNLLSEWYNYLIDVLISKTNDNDEEIRLIVFRGMGNIAYLHKYNIVGHAESQTKLTKNIQMDLDPNSNELLANENNENDIETNSHIQESQRNSKKQLLDETTAEEDMNYDQNEKNQKQKPLFILTNERYAQIIEALFQGIDDRADNCVKEVLASLQNLIQFLPDSFLEPYVISFIEKVTESFEKSTIQIRVSAFNLFGKLIDKLHLSEGFSSYITQELHYVLISVIIHLLDESKQVQDVCKSNVDRIASILNMNELKQFLAEEKISDEYNMDFLDKREQISMNIMQLFLNKFPEKVVQYVETLIEYTKSPDETIQGSALLQLFLALRYSNEIELRENHPEVSLKITERINQILEQSHERKISYVDRYLLKSTVFLIKPFQKI